MASWMTGVQVSYQLGLEFLAGIIGAVNSDASKAGIAFVPKSSEGQPQVEKRLPAAGSKTGTIIYTVGEIFGGDDLYPI